MVLPMPKTRQTTRQDKRMFAPSTIKVNNAGHNRDCSKQSQLHPRSFPMGRFCDVHRLIAGCVSATGGWVCRWNTAGQSRHKLAEPRTYPLQISALEDHAARKPLTNLHHPAEDVRVVVHFAKRGDCHHLIQVYASTGTPAFSLVSTGGFRINA